MVVLNSHGLPSHDVHMDYGDYGDYGLLFAIKAKFVQSFKASIMLFNPA